MHLICLTGVTSRKLTVDTITAMNVKATCKKRQGVGSIHDRGDLINTMCRINDTYENEAHQHPNPTRATACPICENGLREDVRPRESSEDAGNNWRKGWRKENVRKSSIAEYPFDVRDLQFEIPTVINSLLVSKASPMSIDIAATSKQEENETTNTMPGQRNTQRSWMSRDANDERCTFPPVNSYRPKSK